MRIRSRFPLAACLLFVVSLPSIALAQTLEWAIQPVGTSGVAVVQGSGPTHSWRHTSALDASGNLFIAGHDRSTSSCEFPECSRQFLGKYAAADGSLIWRYGITAWSILTAVAVDAGGDAFVSGQVTHDGGMNSHQFVARLSGATGAVVWQVEGIPGEPLTNADTIGFDIVVDAAGNPMVLGRLNGYAVVTKYAADTGAVLWSVAPGADQVSFQDPFGIALDRDGNLVGITFFGDASRGDVPGSLLFKIDGATGARIWATPWSWARGQIRAFNLDGLGKPTIVGPGVAKFSQVDGTLNWQRALSEDGSASTAWDVATASNGDILVTGTQGARSQQVVTARFASASGATIWSAPLSGIDTSHANQIGKSIAVTPTGDVLVAARVFWPGSINYELQTLDYRADGVLLASPRYARTDSADVNLVLSASNAAYVVGDFTGPGTENLVALKYTFASAGGEADLALAASAKPGGAFVGKDFVATFMVSNAGPASASNVRLMVPLPGASSLIWSTPGCTASSSTVECDSAVLESGASVSFSVVLRPTATGAFSLTGTTAADTADPASGNNSASLTASVSAPPVANIVPRYRLYNPISQEHLFTTDANEYNVLGAGGVWVQEGISGHVLDNPGSFNGVTAVPYYRLYCSANRWHHWTTDPNEYYTLATYPCWGAEGVDGYILPANTTGATQLYRLVYGDGRGLHHWTTDANEYSTLTTQYGWFGEGGAGFVIE